MNASSSDFDCLCREHLTRYFATYPDGAMSQEAIRALGFLTAGDGPYSGSPGGWAAGLIYFLVNRYRLPCGVPGLLNSEVEAFFGVTMGTIRKRAARVEELLTI